MTYHDAVCAMGVQGASSVAGVRSSDGLTSQGQDRRRDDFVLAVTPS